MLEFFTGDDFVTMKLEHTPFYVYPLVPSHGIVLFHGSPGIGKSTLMWQMANCIVEGKPFLNLNVNKTNVLLVNLDMPKFGIHERWTSSNFKPLFDVAFCDDFDCTQAGFKHTETFIKLENYVTKNHYGVIIIDCLGHILSGKSIKNDEIPNQVYNLLTQWFVNSCIVVIHHDRKRKQVDSGELGPATEEDFLGSQFWKSSAQVQLHLYKVNKHILKLHHAKSQLSKLLDDEVDLFMDENGTALEIWSEHKQKEEVQALVTAEVHLKKLHPEWDNYAVKKRMELIAAYCRKSVPTIYRWKKSLEESKVNKLTLTV